MFELVEEIESLGRDNYRNIGGSATAAAFGRGGVPKGTKYISYKEKKRE